MSKNNGLILRGNTWHMRFTIKGHTVAESTHTSVRRDAERMLAMRKAEVVQEVVLDDKRPTNLHAAIDAYVASRGTVSSMTNAKNSLLHFKNGILDKPLKKVAMHELQQVITDHRAAGYKPSVVGMRVNYWNAFATWCESQKYTVCGRLEPIKGIKGRVRWLTQEEQTKLLKAVHPNTPYYGKSAYKDRCKQDNWDLLVMLLDTGVRYMEAATMQWNQIDLEKGQLYVTRSKGGKHTTLAITDRLWDVLDRRFGVHPDLIFPLKAGKNSNAVWMREAVKRAGLSTTDGPVTLHVMRHTFAATMIQNGLSLPEVSHLLGHHSTEVTQIYAHFVKEDAADKAAAVLNKLNR